VIFVGLSLTGQICCACCESNSNTQGFPVPLGFTVLQVQPRPNATDLARLDRQMVELVRTGDVRLLPGGLRLPELLVLSNSSSSASSVSNLCDDPELAGMPPAEPDPDVHTVLQLRGGGNCSSVDDVDDPYDCAVDGQAAEDVDDCPPAEWDPDVFGIHDEGSELSSDGLPDLEQCSPWGYWEAAAADLPVEAAAMHAPVGAGDRQNGTGAV
jgi:hypothetical protein